MLLSAFFDGAGRIDLHQTSHTSSKADQRACGSHITKRSRSPLARGFCRSRSTGSLWSSRTRLCRPRTPSGVRLSRSTYRGVRRGWHRSAARTRQGWGRLRRTSRPSPSGSADPDPRLRSSASSGGGRCADSYGPHSAVVQSRCVIPTSAPWRVPRDPHTTARRAMIETCGSA
jgi:hypothetical protein